MSRVVGPHFEAVCRDWALSSGAEVFGTVAGEVAAGVVADPLRRGQIQVDVAVFAPDEPGRPRQVLSLGDTTGARLTCYGGAGFDAELADRAVGDPLIQLVGLEELYA
jgi:hypothetical protein